jgi:hypothetical protein
MPISRFTWLKIVFLFYVLCGFVYSIVIGYCTHSTLINLGDSTHFDSFDSIKYSYVDNNVLNVCVKGIMAGKVLKQDYQLSIPLDKVSKYEHAKDDLSKLENYYLKREHILDECIDNDNKIVPEQIDTPVVNIPKALKEMKLNLQPRTVYEVTKYWGSVNNRTMETKGVRIFYTVPLTDSEPAVVEINTKTYKGRGSKSWLLVLPFAVIADTLSFPLQIAMWINYASAH